MKKFVSLVLSFALLFSLTGCFQTIIYQDEDVKVYEVDVKSLPEIWIAYELIEFTEDLAFGKTKLIAEGMISNIREVAVDYTSMDADITDYLTLVDFTFTDVVYQTSAVSEQAGNTVTLYFGYNTYTLGGVLPHIRDGATVLLFLSPSSDYADSALKPAAYSDYLVNAPIYLFFEKDTNNRYQSCEAFAEYYGHSRTFEEDELKKLLSLEAQTFREE